MDLYATHLPLLTAAVAAAGPGPVLELGAGNYSTPILHEICAATGRSLWTLEGNPSWAERFAHFRSDRHVVTAVTDWDTAVPLLQWAVVFVDHAPAGRRVHEIDSLRERCELMVVHDTEDLRYGYEDVFARFTHRVDYKRLKPWTTILSMRRPLTAFGQL